MKEAKRCSVDLAAALFHFKDKNPKCSLPGIYRTFGISYATAFGIYSSRIQRTRTQKYNKSGPKRLKIAGK